MILESNEALSTAHLLVIIDKCREVHAIDHLNNLIPASDNLHSVPSILVIVGLHLGRVL